MGLDVSVDLRLYSKVVQERDDLRAAVAELLHLAQWGSAINAGWDIQRIADDRKRFAKDCEAAFFKHAPLIGRVPAQEEQEDDA